MVWWNCSAVRDESVMLAGQGQGHSAEPIAVLGYVPPRAPVRGNVRDFGSPALDFQVSYERYWAPGLSATTWWVGFAFKTG